MPERPYPRLADRSLHVLAISTTYGILLFIFLGLLGYYKLQPVIAPELPLPMGLHFYNALAASILVVVAPPGILLYLKHRAIDEMERYLPLFLRDTAELTRAGVSFLRAIVDLSSKPYGKWSTVLRRIAIRVSLGEELEETVSKTLGGYPDAIRRYLIMILEAYRSGGRVSETLDDAARFASTIRGFEEEKRRSLKVYATVLYISVIIFLLSAGATVYMSKTLAEQSAGALPLVRAFASPESLTAMFYLVGVFESIFAGLVVGKLTYRSMVSGVVHVVALIVMVMVFFNVLTLYLA